MRGVFGLLLVMLGLATAVAWMPERDGQRQLAVVTDIAVQGLPRANAPANGSGRTFSPQTPLLATVEAPQHTVAVARPVAQAAEAAAHAAPISSVVTGSIGPATSTPLVKTPRTGLQPEMPRDELVRNLQRELRRVGCYAGEIDGDWGSGSKRAMLNFTDRVNASLPIDHPDFILLTLLKGQSPGVCGRTCPQGQSFSASGRCMPSAVVAQQAKRRGAPDETAVASMTPAPGWSTQVTRAAPAAAMRDQQLDADAVAAGAATGAAVAAAVTPLPGRMSIGGPASSYAAGRSSDNYSAREAVRSAQADSPEARSLKRAAKRTSTARRSGSRYDRPYVVYRSAPSYYAFAPRPSGRAWMSNFFRTN